MWGSAANGDSDGDSVQVQVTLEPRKNKQPQQQQQQETESSKTEKEQSTAQLSARVSELSVQARERENMPGRCCPIVEARRQYCQPSPLHLPVCLVGVSNWNCRCCGRRRCFWLEQACYMRHRDTERKSERERQRERVAWE